MPRIVTPLTATECRAALPREREYRLFDGQGLYLLVKPSGVKSWRLKYTKPDGRPGLTAFGNYPALSLRGARERKAMAISLLASGQDPVEHARLLREASQGSRKQTFEAVARAWHRSMSHWSADHSRRVLGELENNLFPLLGPRPVASLKTRDMLAPLKQVEARGALIVAARLKQRLVCILRFAVQQGLIDYNPAQDLTGSIATRKVTHRPALPLEQLPELLQHLQRDGGRPVTNLAIWLTLLVFTRSSEVRFARWGEIDLKRAMWTIPAEREPIEGVRFSHRGAKMRTSHLVPLSRQAVNLLETLKASASDDELVLPNFRRKQRPLSENTVNSALRRMGFDTRTQVCGHGFRTMACSALLESGLWSRDAVERQMSHQERNGVRAAYIHKAQHLEERRLMMQWWADYLDGACSMLALPAYRSKRRWCSRSLPRNPAAWVASCLRRSAWAPVQVLAVSANSDSWA